MSHLDSVLLGDASWILALVVGLMIEACIGKTAGQRRDAGENTGSGWLTPHACPTRIKSNGITGHRTRHFT